MFSFGKPSKRKFANQLLQAIGRMEGAGQYAYDAEHFRLVRQDGDAEVNLGNMYKEHCALSRDERGEHIAGLASIFCESNDELPETFEEAKPHLRPKIWNRSTFAMLELKRRFGDGEQLEIPLYPLGSHLYSSLVFDTDNAMRSLSEEDLQSWGVTYYQAMEAACQNLDEATVAFAKIGDHFHSSVSGDNYDSSRVLLIDRLRSFDVDGEHIACVPQRDAMYVAGSNDEMSLKIMFDLTEQTSDEEVRPLSPLPLRLEDGEWVDWEPPKNHALRGQFDDLELRFFASLYAEQKELLDTLIEQHGTGPFVASFLAVQKEETEELCSYCVWNRGIENLLPRTQHVAFVDDTSVRASGEWDHVMDVVGELVVADDSYYPTRYQVREFPTEEQLAAIGKSELFEEGDE